MIMEINWGLGRDTNPSSNIKSYITYVSKLPSGQESGQYLALDLGGTNFRVLLVSTVLCCKCYVLCCSVNVLHCIVLYCTVLYCTVQVSLDQGSTSVRVAASKHPVRDTHCC